MASVLDEFRSAAEKIEQEAASKLKELRDSSRVRLSDEKKSLESQIKALHAEAEKKAKPLEKQLEEVENHLRDLTGRSSRRGGTRRRRGGRSGGKTQAEIVLGYVKAKPGIEVKELKAHDDVSDSSVSTTLNKLKVSGDVKKQGSGWAAA